MGPERMTGRVRPRHPRGPRYAVILALAVVMLAGTVAPPGSHPSLHGVTSLGPSATNAVICRETEWQTAHLWVGTSGCQAGFTVMYAQNFSRYNASNQYNFSFFLPWVAEVTPSGQLVRLASPLNPYAGAANVTVGPTEVNLSWVGAMNVTEASGDWTPNDTWAGSGPQWNISNTPVGTTTMDVVFHLFNVTANASANATENASHGVKFDVGVSGWPWASSTDLLGFGLQSLSAAGAHFSFNQSSGTLAESWNANNRTFASLVFGGVANVTYPSAASAPSTVEEQVGLFYAASPARESVALVTFGGVAGNYSSVRYDPWVVFSVGSTSVTPVLPPPSSAGAPAWVAVLLGLVAAVVGLSGILAVVARNERLRKEGEELVQGMRTAISEGTGPPNRSK